MTAKLNNININVKCEWIKQSSQIAEIVSLEEKQHPNICCLQETHIRLKDTNLLKVKGQKKIYHGNSNHKKARVAILISDKL